MTILKKWTIAVAVVMVAVLTSCQTSDPILNDPPQGNYTNFFTQDYTVFQKDWSIETYDDESGMYYYYEFNEPYLTSYIYNNGVMQAFLYTGNGNISPLPFNDYWIDSTGYMYTEQITCEFRPGVVSFIVKASDHAQVLPHYPRYDFRVRFVW